MKRRTVLLIIIACFAVSFFTVLKAENEKEQEAIENVILEFMDGCMNNYEVEAVKKYLHPDYSSFSINNNELQVATISTFIDYAEKMKRKEPEGRKIKAAVKILNTRITGDIGFAKYEVYIGNELHGTDFVTFLKSDGEWKYMRAVAIHHGEEGNCDPEIEKETIRKVIGEALVDGSGNFWDVEAMKKGFHTGFTGISLNGKTLEKDTYSDWVEAITSMKIKEPVGHNVLITGKFSHVDVLGKMGVAETKIYYGTKLTETVYILLLKFTEGWKIITKFDIRHRQ